MTAIFDKPAIGDAVIVPYTTGSLRPDPDNVVTLKVTRVGRFYFYANANGDAAEHETKIRLDTWTASQYMRVARAFPADRWETEAKGLRAENELRDRGWTYNGGPATLPAEAYIAVLAALDAHTD